MLRTVPRFRPDLSDIPIYRPGRPIEEVMEDFGLESVIKLASNECPYPPFPEVQAVIASESARVNRYPDNQQRALRRAVAEFLSVAPDQLWFGGGSSELLLISALAMGGPGASAVYPWPSFGLYRIASRVARSAGIEVPLDEDWRMDLDAMAASIRSDTTLVYLCNPNNPTGTHVSGAAVQEFVDRVPEDVLVVIDEAYHEFVQAVDFHTSLPLAVERDNVVVAHTFSKAYGLAGLRLGYMVGGSETLDQLGRIQLPFTVSSLAQAAAIEALRHQDQVAERMQANAAGLKLLTEGLDARGIRYADSQTNFLYLFPPGAGWTGELLARGVIVREFPEGAVRLTVGTESENLRFLEAVDELLAAR